MTIPVDAEVGTIVYRADASYIDFYGQPRKVDVTYDEYEVTKVTPKGAWVMLKRQLNELRMWKEYYPHIPEDHPEYKPTWYPFNARFVSATKREALEGLRIRKIRHRMHTIRRLIGVEDILYALGVEVKNPVKRVVEWDEP